MDWVKNFDLFLFDFDGLLVNSEHIHYTAYVNLLKEFGFDLGWSFQEFCAVAHLSQEGLKENIYQKFPALYEKHPNWDFLYEKKKKHYLDLLKTSNVKLMDGAEELLGRLKEEKKKSCVVTNSLKNQVDIIVALNKPLQFITHWITREDYLKAKPDPECYLRAISLYGKDAKNIVGFEDTVKGINALTKTPAKTVLICSREHPQLSLDIPSDVTHFETLKAIPNEFI